MLVDAVSARTGGGGTFAANQLSALARIPGLQLTIHASEAFSQRLIAGCPGAQVISHPGRPIQRRLLWEQLFMSRASANQDVVYMPGNFALARTPTPQVLVAQNAWYFTAAIRQFRRDSCPPAMQARLAVEATLARASIRRADRVVAISESMRSMVEEDLGVMPKIRVILSAPPPARAVPSQRECRPSGGGYTLCVAHDDPHKGWLDLIELFTSTPDLPTLKLVGRTTPRRMATFQKLLARGGAKRNVQLLGEVSDPEKLSALYAGADCVIAHSRFESFGLTPVEALMHGTPLVASDVPAHRELCGAAAFYYDPESPDQLAEAIRRRITSRDPISPDPPILGRTWSDNARELASVLVEAADVGGRDRSRSHVHGSATRSDHD